MRVWTLGLLLLPAWLAGHDVDLPEWVRQGRAAMVDLRELDGRLALELSFRDQDAAVLSGGLEPATPQGAAAVRARLALGLRVNGQAPLRLEPLSRSAKLGYLRWLARFDSPLPAQLSVDAALFDQGGWIQYFDFLPGAEDPGERSWFRESGQAFEWPQNRRVEVPRVWGRFFGLGFTHILPWGWDHLLFVLGLCLGASGWRSLLGLVTAFTVAHSLSLGLVAAGKLGPSPGLVEPLIAASIAWIAAENLWWKKGGVGWRRWLLVFGFGLLHGLGFAGALLETGIPTAAFWSALFAFNMGVEAGQLSVVLFFLLLTRFFLFSPDTQKRVFKRLNWGIGSLGLVALLLRITDV